MGATLKMNLVTSGETMRRMRRAAKVAIAELGMERATINLMKVDVRVMQTTKPSKKLRFIGMRELAQEGVRGSAKRFKYISLAADVGLLG